MGFIYAAPESSNDGFATWSVMESGPTEAAYANAGAIEIGGAAAFLYSERARYKVLYGGRGSLKSWSAARTLLLLGGQQRLRILCAREFQNSIADSVHRVLADQIGLMGLGDFYQVQNTTIVGANGTEFIFVGLRYNVESIKSLEGVDICWVEEAERVSERSWEILVPTVRKAGSEIWVTFNPAQESDPTYQRFVVNPPPGTIVRKVSWKDNPWLPDVLKTELEHLRRTDPDAYHHVWEGGTWTRSAAQVFNGKWIIDDFVPAPGTWNGPYFGADWGFSTDPTVLLRMWVYDQRLYVEHDAYKVGCDIVDTPALFDRVPGSRTHCIRADNSRPETINHVRSAGFRCEAADKWAGSVEDGISFLRGFEKIVIHPRCKHMAEEARLYSYKVDKLTGDVLPDLKPGHDHCWDAVRYGLQPMIKRKDPPPKYVPFHGGWRPRR